jgi:pyruvate/2-oxoglutarate/acetoin dehydrogenase E1 component
VQSVQRTNRLLICHEALERGGWAAEVAMEVMEQAFDYLDAPIAHVCAKNLPVPYSSSLEEFVIPSEQQLIAAVRRSVQ